MHAVYVATGAACGALLRWQLGVWLSNSWGIVLANGLGCALMGVALALSLEEAPRLLWITGFLGGLTTFSALSAEVAMKLWTKQIFDAVMTILLHVVGGVASTLLGFWLTLLWIKH